MGIPSFFRWLKVRYPHIIVDVIEELPEIVDGIEQNVDFTNHNPNGVEFDNLYLDMNGLIHPCFHPEGRDPPSSLEAMFEEIFTYIDRIFSIVRPRKLIYMALDGVAPRAKMNQQRARRFRSAFDRQQKARSKMINPDDPADEVDERDQAIIDSNVITPGTPFMHQLSLALRWYVRARQAHDPAWANVKVLLSDASVPGEGEHKIMGFIRQQRCQEGYDSQTTHCMYGLDADLIMLALATHEPRFALLREVVFPKGPVCTLCGQMKHDKAQCNRYPATESRPIAYGQAFQWLYVWRLREYLAREFEPLRPQMGAGMDYSLERIIDDFVFLCYFCGNDFLPHMPSLEIREDAIVRLMMLYKRLLPHTGSYLTDCGELISARLLKPLLTEIAKLEPRIFQQRKAKEEMHTRRRANSQSRRYKDMRLRIQRRLDEPNVKADERARLQKRLVQIAADASESRKSWAQKEMEELEKQNKEQPKHVDGDMISLTAHFQTKNKVELHRPGYIERYHTHCEIDEPITLAHQYLRGLRWVLHYYFRQCPDWGWFYPSHYAPLASDLLASLDSYRPVTFPSSAPFYPFEQLIGVLPPASAHCLPTAIREMMCDPEGEMAAFYPTHLHCDMLGAGRSWQAVVRLPFIDERTLKDAAATCFGHLSKEEQHRNARGDCLLMVSTSHPGSEKLETGSQIFSDAGKPLQLACRLTVHANLLCRVGEVCPAPMDDLPTVTSSTEVRNFYDPAFPDGWKGYVLLPGVTSPERGHLTEEAWDHGSRTRRRQEDDLIGNPNFGRGGGGRDDRRGGERRGSGGPNRGPPRSHQGRAGHYRPSDPRMERSHHYQQHRGGGDGRRYDSRERAPHHQQYQQMGRPALVGGRPAPRHAPPQQQQSGRPHAPPAWAGVDFGADFSNFKLRDFKK
eukprot:gnl/Dysnectes_brevis/3238_a4051_772.p1 GENE.gnl/Dysnectes_brevis/3238_a4051_772~~gnl/Dysnectes_brevis/3238_a4051_772.p1  ORF type:complete len:932 (-),score=273.59 gnl/Dysnectes_brevis/3238_a4051_772:66-2792(-)